MGTPLGRQSSAVVSILRFLLYMVGSSGSRLYTVDRATGVATAVDSNITRLWGIRGDPHRASLGRQYALHGGVSTHDRLYTVDRAAGVATAVDSNITDFGVSEGTTPAGLAWDGSTLYMVGSSLA